MFKSILLTILCVALVPQANAQMRGMGPGTSNTTNGSYMQMFSAEGGMMGGGMGFGMSNDFKIGPDGTVYIVHVTSSTPMGSSTPSWQYELLALSPVNGNTLWKLTLPGGRISDPVFSTSTDGLIFITVDDFMGQGLGRMSFTQTNTNAAKLLIISHTASSASIASTITPGVDALSEPSIVADPAGGYFISVVGYDIPSTMMQGSPTLPTKTLFAYKPNGSLKFSVKLP